MTIEDWQERDRLISELEAKGKARTIRETQQLRRLTNARDLFWARLPATVQHYRLKAERLAAYAAQHDVRV